MATPASSRGSFDSVPDLITAIDRFFAGWNEERCHPFVWTKTADEILDRTNTKSTFSTRH